MTDLFPDDTPQPDRGDEPAPDAPLADRLRPRALDEVIGQDHLTGPEGGGQAVFHDTVGPAGYG